ncbi:DUF2147 domain-containing protein [Fulvimarina sp. MAC8]|uniref:DUF2147 domain-containing protein n=1 Tax=Fulvimarina sp. MAC8 TaxID=3162874 RepID=UPI0032EEB3BF
MRKRTSALAASALLAFSGLATSAFASEPIVGQWRAPGGGIVEVAPCGGEFCATVVSGEHKGKSVGRMSGAGDSYSGTVTDPREDKTYDGTASIEAGGNALKLQGCALKVFCKSQTWNRV